MVPIQCLVLGTERDPHVSAVKSHLDEMGISTFILDYNKKVDVTLISGEDGFDFEFCNRSLADNFIIWNRSKLKYGSPYYFNVEKYEIEACGKNRALDWREKEWNSLYRTIISFYRNRTVNRIEAINCLEKPYQYHIAKKIGFKFPQSIVSTSKCKMIEFSNRFENVALKALAHNMVISSSCENSMEAIMTNQCNAKIIESYDEQTFYLNPTFLQHYINKKFELRIIIISDKCIAFRIPSQDNEYTKIDWRYGNLTLPFWEFEIDSSLIRKLRSFLDNFSLFYGVFDFIVDDDDTYWFLECNHDGQWIWLDPIVNQRISKTFANSFCELIYTQCR